MGKLDILNRISEECENLRKQGKIIKEIEINDQLYDEICIEKFEKEIEQKHGIIHHPLDILKTYESVPVVKNANIETYRIKYEENKQIDPRAKSRLVDRFIKEGEK